jgi:hypothetical protein
MDKNKLIFRLLAAVFCAVFIFIVLQKADYDADKGTAGYSEEKNPENQEANISAVSGLNQESKEAQAKITAATSTPKPAVSGSKTPAASSTKPAGSSTNSKPATSTTATPKPTETPAPKPQNTLDIRSRLVNFGFEKPASPRSIDTIIIHSSYDALGSDPDSVEGIIHEYEMYGVTAHYLIGRDGTINRLVEDGNIAYHAGGGRMPDGRTRINDFSIGIEMVSTLTVGPNETQYKALVGLIKSLKAKYGINHILGHKDVLPERKTDPWAFDWHKFNLMLGN